MSKACLPVSPSANADGVVVVGAGLAGLFAALKLAPLNVTVLSPTPIGEGAASVWAQAGVAAALSEGDTPEDHAADTIRAGAGLVDEAVALLMAQEARARVEDLLRYGVTVRQGPRRPADIRSRSRSLHEAHLACERGHGGPCNYGRNHHCGSSDIVNHCSRRRVRTRPDRPKRARSGRRRLPPRPRSQVLMLLFCRRGQLYSRRAALGTSIRSPRTLLRPAAKASPLPLAQEPRSQMRNSYSFIQPPSILDAIQHRSPPRPCAARALSLSMAKESASCVRCTSTQNLAHAT